VNYVLRSHKILLQLKDHIGPKRLDHQDSDDSDPREPRRNAVEKARVAICYDLSSDSFSGYGIYLEDFDVKKGGEPRMGEAWGEGDGGSLRSAVIDLENKEQRSQRTSLLQTLLRSAPTLQVSCSRKSSEQRSGFGWRCQKETPS
jgi:hypothetical protein